MKRQDVLDHIRIAGYHEDQKTYIRLYTENRVSAGDAAWAYERGIMQKRSGMKCACHLCKKPA